MSLETSAAIDPASVALLAMILFVLSYAPGRGWRTAAPVAAGAALSWRGKDGIMGRLSALVYALPTMVALIVLVRED